eukprot:6460310-Amphidinium_carterae.1
MLVSKASCHVVEPRLHEVSVQSHVRAVVRVVATTRCGPLSKFLSEEPGRMAKLVEDESVIQ